MALLQVQIDNRLKKALHGSARIYGVPVSSLVKIVLTRSFLLDGSKSSPENMTGNIFNAERDNHGKGVMLDDILSRL